VFAIDRRLRDGERQHADQNQNKGHEQAEVVGDDDAEARCVAVPQQQ